MTLHKIVQELERAHRYDPLMLRREDIPAEPGINVWYFKTDGRTAYAGKADGHRGLQYRIWDQHLNPHYLEGRPKEVNRPADWFQLRHAILVKGTPHIDSSRLRRNIGRLELIPPGQPTVDFIRASLQTVWVILPRSEVRCKLSQLKAWLRSNGGLAYNYR